MPSSIRPWPVSFAGTTVTIQTQWIGGEGDNFQAASQPFKDATGIDDRGGRSAGRPATRRCVQRRAQGWRAARHACSWHSPRSSTGTATTACIVDVATIMDIEKLDGGAARD